MVLVTHCLLVVSTHRLGVAYCHHLLSLHSPWAAAVSAVCVYGWLGSSVRLLCVWVLSDCHTAPPGPGVGWGAVW